MKKIISVSKYEKKVKFRTPIFIAVVFSNIQVALAAPAAPPPPIPVVDVASNGITISYSAADAAAGASLLFEMGTLAVDSGALLLTLTNFAVDKGIIDKKNEKNTSGDQQKDLIVEFSTDSNPDSLSYLLDGDISSSSDDSTACQGSQTCEKRLNENADSITVIEELNDLFIAKNERLENLSNQLANETSQQGVLRLESAIAIEQSDIALLKQQIKAYKKLQIKNTLQNQQNILAASGSAERAQ